MTGNQFSRPQKLQGLDLGAGDESTVIDIRGRKAAEIGQYMAQESDRILLAALGCVDRSAAMELNRAGRLSSKIEGDWTTIALDANPVISIERAPRFIQNEDGTYGVTRAYRTFQNKDKP